MKSVVPLGMAADVPVAVDRQFSGIVPQGLKNTPKRFGACAGVEARRLFGIMISSQGSATPTPRAPLSMVRRESWRGMRRCRSGFDLDILIMASSQRSCRA